MSLVIALTLLFACCFYCDRFRINSIWLAAHLDLERKPETVVYGVPSMWRSVHCDSLLSSLLFLPANSEALTTTCVTHWPLHRRRPIAQPTRSAFAQFKSTIHTSIDISVYGESCHLNEPKSLGLRLQQSWRSFTSRKLAHSLSRWDIEATLRGPQWTHNMAVPNAWWQAWQTNVWQAAVYTHSKSFIGWHTHGPLRLCVSPITDTIGKPASMSSVLWYGRERGYIYIYMQLHEFVLHWLHLNDSLSIQKVQLHF